MGEGFEILVWLAVMAFIGLRGAMQKNRAEQKKREEAERRESRDRAVQALGEADAGSPDGRRGILGRFTDFAAELERQMQEAQTEQRARAEAEMRAREEMARRGPRGPDDITRARPTVVVPGRRVYPRSVESIESAEEEHASHWDDWESAPESHRLHPDETAGQGARLAAASRVPRPATKLRRGSVRGREPRGDGLSKLDRFDALKRAVILADVLGPPPGLDGITPAERRLDEQV
ncbi:MAG: hypothetical protein R3195_04625 [Gemmatimonadota bacterium]|nr:hypothetical protein [Gemmatimonadota bacterium]